MNETDIFVPMLREGEMIVWTGKPKNGIRLIESDRIFLPMSIILIGFSGFLDYVMIYYQPGIFYIIITLTLNLIAVYTSIGRFILSKMRREKTFYCITSQRILKCINDSPPKWSTLPLKNIEKIEYTQENDGAGFILFGDTNPLFPWLLGSINFSKEEFPGFEMIPDVKKVYQIIISLLRPNVSNEILNAVQFKTPSQN
jgi:hypothetical protein